MYVVSPGGYFTIDRDKNRLMIEPGYYYEYTVRYSITKKIRGSCNPNIVWDEDDCRQRKVTKFLLLNGNQLYYLLAVN